MHPILSQIRRLGIYLLAWVPFVGLLFYLLTTLGGVSSLQGAVMVPVLCVLYAFACLSSWYSCKATSLETSSFGRLLLTHLLGAATLSILWVLSSRLLAKALSSYPGFESLPDRMLRSSPLLFGAGVFLYLLSVGLHYVLLALQASQQAEKRVMQAQILARESELRALKTQINPHFLFNSLHSISALTSLDAARAREMCVALADFLRLTLGLGEKNSITLKEELHLLHNYLAVEKIRFGARLNMTESVEDELLACAVPPLLLQPLIENAITHGIANLPEGGSIALRIQQRNGLECLRITITNDFDPDMPARRKSGLGLLNVRQRLETRYGSRATFSTRKLDHQFEVQLDVPGESEEGV
jgi:hypothetical protein